MVTYLRKNSIRSIAQIFSQRDSIFVFPCFERVLLVILGVCFVVFQIKNNDSIETKKCASIDKEIRYLLQFSGEILSNMYDLTNF